MKYRTAKNIISKRIKWLKSQYEPLDSLCYVFVKNGVLIAYDTAQLYHMQCDLPDGYYSIEKDNAIPVKLKDSIYFYDVLSEYRDCLKLQTNQSFKLKSFHVRAIKAKCQGFLAKIDASMDVLNELKENPAVGFEHHRKHLIVKPRDVISVFCSRMYMPSMKFIGQLDMGYRLYQETSPSQHQQYEIDANEEWVGVAKFMLDARHLINAGTTGEELQFSFQYQGEPYIKSPIRITFQNNSKLFVKPHF